MTAGDFQPPGPGSWERDLSHCPPAPTPLFRRVMQTAITTGYRQVFDDYGAPLETMDLQMVHGGMYRRLVPLVGADRGGAPPPRPILWLASRLHPAFRRQNRKALELFANKQHLEPLAEWASSERQWWIDANRQLQDEDVAQMTDSQLADHVERVGAHLMAGNIRHHVLHGTDMGPIGDLLSHSARWGVDPVEVMMLLKGSSPATTEAAEFGAAIAAGVIADGGDPMSISSIDEIQGVGALAAAALNDYLDLYGWRLLTSYDIEGLAVSELPSSVVALMKANVEGVDDPTVGLAEAESSLRSTVPVEHREYFDELLDDARRAYGLRDDNGPLTAEWPLGLTRRAYLEAGARLAAAGRSTIPERVFEVDIEELSAMLRGAETPTKTELDTRRAHRDWEASLAPPAVLGDAPVDVDPTVLPKGLRRVTESVLACVSMLEKEPGGTPLEGMGIGERAYTGRARLADRPEDVLGTFEAGDVLVAAWTAPTYNAVIASAGAIIVEEGGLLCHAAVMARELGVPAIIGATDALATINDGDMVTVDPVAGVVTVA